MVWTKPEHGGKPFAAAITATHERDDQPIYLLALESTRTDGAVRSETLLVTPSHPFYVPAKRDFVQMGELRQGDLLQSLADGEGEGTSTRVVSARLYKPVEQKGDRFIFPIDTGTPLTLQVKGMIENLVSNGKRFDVQNGIPGLHAEVRAVNSALTRYPKVSIDDVKVATYKLAPKQGQGDKFEACSNCSGVLKDADVITGRKH